MPTVTAQMILDRAARTLHDDDNVRWTTKDWLAYISDAQREIVMMKPDAGAKNDVVQLQPGTKQSIPEDGMMFIEVVRNMGKDGNEPGRVVRQMRRHILDAARPDWHAQQSSGTSHYYLFDDRDPKVFYVTPPQPEPAHYAEMIYAAAPAEINNASDVIGLDDIYATPIFYYAMSRAHSKATTPNIQVAQMYYEQFGAAVQGRQQALYNFHPERVQGAQND